jgi:nitrate reductase cytochrome c-type subunit
MEYTLPLALKFIELDEIEAAAAPVSMDYREQPTVLPSSTENYELTSTRTNYHATSFRISAGR